MWAKLFDSLWAKLDTLPLVVVVLVTEAVVLLGIVVWLLVSAILTSVG